MRVVLQRVSEASVHIDGESISAINAGLLVLLGIEHDDQQDDIDWLCTKIANLRIFADNQGLMNMSTTDVQAEILVVSQFTLHASTKKGNRPSFIKAARPDTAIPLYERFLKTLASEVKREVKAGVFGAYMQIQLVNDGPVTIIIDSKQRE